MNDFIYTYTTANIPLQEKSNNLNFIKYLTTNNKIKIYLRAAIYKMIKN